MPEKLDRKPRRGTPISDGLGSDLQQLGSLLASHTRGLDEHLQSQARRLAQRQVNLMAESQALLQSGIDFQALPIADLKTICRDHHLKGWSRLRREELIVFLERHLAPECEQASSQPSEGNPNAESLGFTAPADASRSERLMLLLLNHLQMPPEAIAEAWRR